MVSVPLEGGPSLAAWLKGSSPSEYHFTQLGGGDLGPSFPLWMDRGMDSFTQPAYYKPDSCSDLLGVGTIQDELDMV